MNYRNLLWPLVAGVIAAGLLWVSRQPPVQLIQAQQPAEVALKTAATEDRAALLLKDVEPSVIYSESPAEPATPSETRFVKQPLANSQPTPGLSQTNREPEKWAEVLKWDPVLQENARANYDSAMDRLETAHNAFERYLVLNDAAKLSFTFGKYEAARDYANELLALDAQFSSEPWRSGVAVHDGNLVLGRIEFLQGRVDLAGHYLEEAGKTTGSPVLNSFGPNLSLAMDLLQSGEQDAVIRYFDLCRNFWSLGGDRLTQWTKEVKAGQKPDFGANLLY
jgi:tetratricopeptide (TPR) repeat protein